MAFGNARFIVWQGSRPNDKPSVFSKNLQGFSETGVRTVASMKMESISVQGIGPLAHKVPESVMQVEAGLTVGGLLEQLGIPQKDVMLVFVDSTLATWQTVLRDGSRVCFSPYMCGG